MGGSSSEAPGESTAVIAERNENMVDKDIYLSVVRPGDSLKSTTVPGRYAAVAKIL